MLFPVQLKDNLPFLNSNVDNKNVDDDMIFIPRLIKQKLNPSVQFARMA